MNIDVLQGLRDKLTRRVCRLRSPIQTETMHLLLKQFCSFLRGGPAIMGVLDSLSSLSARHLEKLQLAAVQ